MTEDTKPTIVVVIGAPFSGKSDLVDKLTSAYGFGKFKVARRSRVAQASEIKRAWKRGNDTAIAAVAWNDWIYLSRCFTDAVRIIRVIVYEPVVDISIKRLSKQNLPPEEHARLALDIERGTLEMRDIVEYTASPDRLQRFHIISSPTTEVFDQFVRDYDPTATPGIWIGDYETALRVARIPSATFENGEMLRGGRPIPSLVPGTITSTHADSDPILAYPSGLPFADPVNHPRVCPFCEKGDLVLTEEPYTQMITGVKFAHLAWPYFLCTACKSEIITPAQAKAMDNAIKTWRKGLRITAAACRNPDTGEVFCLPPPARHHHLIHAGYGHNTGYHEQGFMTTYGTFVDRANGREIADYNDQILKTPRDWANTSKDTLFSEDLW